ncbi:hypothetical protein VM636_03350 [Streptomyces sp. SCSIO 75703]|uniref:hypothetical protein n=1 Tax=unclassified Streptomyces TaxID=2593676 RepID=UPI0018FEA88B|nr:hypothetical protein [Streptomyces sp. TP-A0875]
MAFSLYRRPTRKIMSEASSSTLRRSWVVWVVFVVVCLAGVGGIGAWWFGGSRGDSRDCRELVRDGRVRDALGDDASGMSCAEFGAAVKRATVGAVPGEHSPEQAQAMKDVLVAVDRQIERGGGRLEPALRVPLAEALADYAADTEAILGIGTADYVRNAPPTRPAWEDADGVHMAVPRDALLRAVRALSEDASGYVALRMAATRHAAEGLAVVGTGATGAELTAPTVRNARTLGALDAVAADVRKKEGGRWVRDVFEGLTGKASPPPAYAEEPVDHLVVSWRRSLLSRGVEESPAALEEQSADMADVWGKAVGVDEEARGVLRGDALESAYRARGDALRRLG